MRQLTFEGFLKTYVPYLAGVGSASMTTLGSTVEESPRVAEPLVLLAVVTGRADRLVKPLSGRPDLVKELAVLADLHSDGKLESALASVRSGLRPEYTKVWRTFVARRDATARDARLKLAARDRILGLERGKAVTRYRMAKDLGLNPGNLHAFLAQGNVGKVSLRRAVELVDYLEAV